MSESFMAQQCQQSNQQSRGTADNDKAANQPAAVSRTDLEHAELRVVKAFPIDEVRTLRQVALHVRQHLHPVTATTQLHFKMMR